jgi:hypothetical protein
MHLEGWSTPKTMQIMPSATGPGHVQSFISRSWDVSMPDLRLSAPRAVALNRGL